MVFISGHGVGQVNLKYLLLWPCLHVADSGPLCQIVVIGFQQVIHGYPHLVLVYSMFLFDFPTFDRPIHKMFTAAFRTVTGRLGSLLYWLWLYGLPELLTPHSWMRVL